LTDRCRATALFLRELMTGASETGGLVEEAVSGGCLRDQPTT
jgi:hypothetical protein